MFGLWDRRKLSCGTTQIDAAASTLFTYPAIRAPAGNGRSTPSRLLDKRISFALPSRVHSAGSPRRVFSAPRLSVWGTVSSVLVSVIGFCEYYIRFAHFCQQFFHKKFSTAISLHSTPQKRAVFQRGWAASEGGPSDTRRTGRCPPLRRVPNAVQKRSFRRKSKGFIFARCRFMHIAVD